MNPKIGNPKRAEGMEAWLDSAARYTRFVFLGKRILWVLAVGLTLLVVLMAWLNSDSGGARVVLSEGSNTAPAKPEPAVMAKPRFIGVDSKNRPYSLVADKAVQKDINTVIMQNVNAEITLSSGAWVAITAQEGEYALSSKMAELRRDVHLFYEGYEFRSEVATLELATGKAYGQSPVEGQGAAGTLKANSFEIGEHGAIVRFKGNVKVVLYL